jgi:large subunit ribosomal protein L13
MKATNRITVMAKPGEIPADWYVVDATDKVLGRLASSIAQVLIGKGKPMYTPHVLCGDFVVVINAKGVALTGKKWDQKMYKRWTGYPGGLRQRTASEMRDRKPEFMVEEAVRRMLPKGRLGRRILTRLKVYPGPEHPHEAQAPKPLEL